MRGGFGSGSSFTISRYANRFLIDRRREQRKKKKKKKKKRRRKRKEKERALDPCWKEEGVVVVMILVEYMGWEGSELKNINNI